MGLISLEGMEFFAYHGVYDEEQKIGNKYSIDLRIKTDFSEAAQTDKLHGTINYETLYKIVAKVMQNRIRLLEHVGYQIVNEIKNTFPDLVQEVEVGVSKYNPPIGGVCAKAKIVISG